MVTSAGQCSFLLRFTRRASFCPPHRHLSPEYRGEEVRQELAFDGPVGRGMVAEAGRTPPAFGVAAPPADHTAAGVQRALGSSTAVGSFFAALRSAGDVVVDLRCLQQLVEFAAHAGSQFLFFEILVERAGDLRINTHRRRTAEAAENNELTIHRDDPRQLASF